MSEMNEYSTKTGTPMKTTSILTGMDKLVNPKQTPRLDQIFDSSPSRDINAGSRENDGGIDYKALKTGNPLGDKS